MVWLLPKRQGVHRNLNRMILFCSVLRLRGGGKKRKKKNYTTPKKVAHKNKKVKLAMLKYYKVRFTQSNFTLVYDLPQESAGIFNFGS